MKYTGINIGPITATLSMAKRPRELWSASYMFSHLMKCIIDSIPADRKILSPSSDILKGGTSNVGLYPDRIFIEGDIDCPAVEKKAMEKFLADTGLGCPGYFNIMSVQCEAEKAAQSISQLNRKLDIAELFNMPKSDSDRESILKFIQDKANPLFKIATGQAVSSVPSLGEIAAAGKKERDGWKKFITAMNDENPETDPYKEAFRNDFKSCDKYICVVQADGDNMGKTFSNPALSDQSLKMLSEKLLEFGKKACKVISDYGGLPVYAGGDDLLFFAPVSIDNGRMTIFDLVEKIDSECFRDIADSVKNLGLKYKDSNGTEKESVPSMSYGISITYYKYPLYEALSNATGLLFDAKAVKGKNALAWEIVKHSGSSFKASISRSIPGFKEKLQNLIRQTTDGNTVSAVSHKMREFQDLVDVVLHSMDETRVKSMFKYIFECTDSGYFDAVKEMMQVIYGQFGDTGTGDMMFNMLRTAKFIKGEDPDHD